MPLIVFYGLLVAGFYVARSGLRAACPRRRWLRACGGAALMIATALYFGRDLHRASDVLRYGLSAVALIAAVHVATGGRAVHCSLSLFLVFFCLAGILVSYQAEFLGAITISINAGAVVVALLFILMLLDLRAEVGRESSAGYALGALALSALVTGLILAGLLGPRGRPADGPPAAWFRQQASAYGADRQDTRLGRPAPQEAALRATGRPYPLRPISGYAADIGWELYTKYTVPFEVASLILTVAVVAAVAIGRQTSPAAEAKGAA